MKFIIDPNTRKVFGTLFYMPDGGYAFDFEPPQPIDISLEFGYLLLEFDSESGLAKQLGGYHPHLGWINKKLTTPKAIEGGLILINAKKFLQPPGVALSIIEDSQWNTYFDKETSWVCFGDFATNDTDTAVEFANGIIAVLHDHQIKALWMKPVFK